jgi:hypothetical protein
MQKETEKLKKKIEELQKVNYDLTVSSGKLALENMDLKIKLDKLEKRSKI